MRPIVEAIKEQADRYLHQCFMIGVYEPYVEVCRRLAELSPCGGGEQRSILVNTGAEAIENAVKIARWATGRQAVIAFDNAFHGRTLLAMTMTSKVKPYKAGLRAVRAGGLPRAGAVPVPRHLLGRLDRRARASLQGRRRPVDRRLRRPRAGAGRGRVRRDAAGLSRRSSRSSAASTGSCGSTTRCSRASDAPGRCGRSSSTPGAEPDLTVFGKSIGGGLPLAGVTGGAEVMDAVPPGGLGGTFGGNPLSCAAALAVLDVVTEPEFLAQARELGVTLRARLDDIASRDADDRRGARPRLDARLRVRRSARPTGRQAVVDAAFERGLVLLSCGLYGNVIRLLPPLNIAPDELDEGLAILEESLGA